MAGEKGRIPWAVVVALLVIGLGIVAVTLRHKVTVIDGTVLLLERWTGRITFISRDGRITRMEGGGPAKDSGYRLSLFKTNARETGAKTAKGAAGTVGGAAKVSRKTPDARGATAKNSGAAASQKEAQIPAAKPSPFGNGSTTSKDLWETGAKAYASIKWEEEQARFQMAIRPYTDEVKKLRRDKKETVRVDLVDGRGAAILTLSIPFDDMKPVRDDKNKITALEYGKNIPLCKSDLASIQNWTIKRKA